MNHHDHDEHLVLMRRLGLIALCVYVAVASAAFGFLVAFALGFVR